MFQISDTHYAATWLLDERAPKVENHLREAYNVRKHFRSGTLNPRIYIR